MNKVYNLKLLNKKTHFTMLQSYSKTKNKVKSELKNISNLSKKALFALLVLSSCYSGIAQNTANYTFSNETNGSLTDMSSGTSTLVGSSQDNTSSSPVSSIGFTFYFMGQPYTQFSASSNGLVRLGSVLSNTIYSVAQESQALISPFARDLATHHSGGVRLKRTGSEPNRVLTVEWFNMSLDKGSTTADGTYQLRLYESNGAIEFVYGNMSLGTGSGTTGFSIGFSSSNAVNTYATVNTSTGIVTTTGGATTNSYTAGQNIPNLHSTTDGSRRIYTFTPPAAPTAPTDLTYDNITQTGIRLNWTDSPNETGYLVYSSTDNINFSLLTTSPLASGTTLYNHTGLNHSTTYYYRVVAINEGAISSFLEGSQQTLGPLLRTSAASGNWGDAATWTPSGVPTAIDSVLIADGHTVTINANAICAKLTVGQGTSGVLTFDNNTSQRNIIINNSLTVSNGAIFDAGNYNKINTIYLGGNSATTNYGIGTGSMTINGTLDLYTGASNGKGTITFFGNIDASISGTGSIDFNNTNILNKGNANITIGGTPPTLELLCGYTVQGANTSGFIATHTAGILKIGGTFSLSNPVYVASTYTIPAEAGFWLDNPNFSVTGLNGSPTNNGLLKISDGTFNLGALAGNAMSGGGGAQFPFEGGTTNIAGRLNTAGAGTVLNITGGTINVTTIGNAANSSSGFGFTNANNTINISGGTINLVQRSTGTTKLDYYINGSNINITGGTLNIGTPATATNFDFSIFGHIPNLVIDNTTNNKTARIIDASTIHGTATINTGTTLNLIAGTLTLKSTITNNGTITANNTGTNAIQFQGTAAQTLDGVITSNQISGLVLDNPLGVNLEPSIQINRVLTLLQGELSCNGTLTLGSGGSNTFAYTNSGGSIVGTPTFNYGSGTNTFTYSGTSNQTTGIELPSTIATGTLTINNTEGVTLNSALNIENIVLTNGVLTTSATNLLTVTNTEVGGAARTNGYINGPLVRRLPASLSTDQTYLWPLGKSDYTPFELVNARTSTGTGISIIAEVFDTNCGGTIGSGIGILHTDRYWESNITSGTSTLNTTTVRVTDNSVSNTKALGQAASIDGTYNYVGATQSGTTLRSNAITSLGFFVIGNKRNLAGTYDVGDSHNLKKLTDIANELNNSIVTADVIYELNSDYDGTTGETFPITFNQYLTSGGNWTVTIRVKSGAGMRTTSGSSTTQLINLNGVDNLIFDGREGGVGTTKAWTFLNTNTTSGNAFTFINDATSNTIKYCDIRSGNHSTLSGTIVFSTGTTTGNDNNTIDNCDIFDGASTPRNGIYSLGTTTTAEQNNSGNIISNCNIYNFYGTAVTAGINIAGGNTDWTITGNSFYQTTSRAGNGQLNYGILINNTSGNNFIISNNKIGGNEQNCGGTPLTYTLSGTTRFIAIHISVGTTVASTIQNNTITNINISSSFGDNTLPGVFGGIHLAFGSANIDNNTIGSTTGNGSISVTTSTTGGVSMGFGRVATTGVCTISNNTIGSINVQGSTASNSALFNGIWNTGAGTSLTIDNNLIGSTTTANSINSSNAATGTTAALVQGILNTGNTAIAITNNTIANLNSAYVPGSANTNTIVRGILSSSGTNTITGNTIRHLSTAANATGTLASASVIGISMTSTTGGTTLSQNTIYELSNSNTAATAKSVIGIHFSGYINASLSVNHLIDKNNIHSLYLSSPTSSHIIGINLTQGRTVTVQNNMIRLGISSAGDITGPHQIRGIEDANQANSLYNYYNNSVFIGGTEVTGASATYAINSLSTNTRNFRNNIFVNNRSNGTGTGKHYAIKVAGTAMNPAGLTINHNIYHANGTGGVFGIFNNIDRGNISDWRRAIGQDANSGYGDPNFVNATNAIPDLHVQSPTPAEGSGVEIPTIIDDFDGETRLNFTPHDIGADAGNYTHADIFAPTITYTPLSPLGSTLNRNLTVSITDFTGVPTNGANQPRIWYRRSSGTPTDWASTAGSLQSGTATDGTWLFTIDYNQIPITPVIGEVYQYYIVAQDETSFSNIITNPFNGVHSDVNTQTLVPTILNSFTIAQEYAGSYDLGSSEGFISITGNNSTTGLFAALNNGIVVGDIVINITSDITETGDIALNEWQEDGVGNYTLTIQADGVAPRTITASNRNNALFRFNGADRVTIDGGNEKFLTLINTHTTPSSCRPVIEFNNGSNNCTVKNCTILNNAWGSSYAVILFGNTGSNSNILIEGNHIGDPGLAPDTYNEPYRAIASSANATNNKLVTIKNNTIFNFAKEGISFEHGDSCSIIGNSLYRTRNPYGSTVIGISLRYGNGHTISNNFIGGTAPSCSGDTMRIREGFQGILLRDVGNTTTTKIENNTIQNINITGSSVVRSEMIMISSGASKILIKGNTIGHKSIANSIMQSKYTTATLGGGSHLFGIRNGSTDPTTIIDSNTIANLTFDAETDSESITGINTPNGNVTRNSIFKLSSTTGAKSLSIVGIEYTLAAPVGTGEVSNNMISLGTKGLDIIKGIWDWTLNNHIANYIYNTVYIYGQASASFANSNTAFNKSETQIEPVYNNIFINSTTGGNGSEKHLAYSANNSAHDSDYNLILTSDATKVFNLGGVGAIDFSTWQSSGLDNSSWFYTTTTEESDYSRINPSNLFIDAENGDLRINTANPEAWAVYGKGVAGANSHNISYDYTGTARGTTYGYGTCIGAHQFAKPSVAPIAANQSGTLSTGSTTSYTLGGRTICNIDWTDGNAPTAMEVLLYSGTNPPNRNSSIKYHNYYVKCTPTGGSDYTYTMNLRFDKAFHGNLSETAATGLAKYGTSWLYDIDGVPTNIEGVQYEMSRSGYTEFSNFTGSEKGTTLPILLIDFSGKRMNDTAKLYWSTASEINNNYFEILRSTDLVNFEVVGIVSGAGNSNVQKDYSFDDKLSKSIQNAILYYQLNQVDFDGKSSNSKPIALNPKDNYQTNEIINLWVNSSGEVIIEYYGIKSSPVKLKIIDALGKNIFSTEKNISEGFNQISLKPANPIKSGMYFLIIENDTIFNYRKFIIENNILR